MTREVHVLADPAAVARAAAERFVDAAQAIVWAGRRFVVSLAGGSTPKETYRLLAAPGLRERVDWAQVVVLFGDERCVPPDHPDSNYRMAREALLEHVPVPPDQILRMKGELGPREAATEYAHRLSQLLEGAAIDLALLGLGPDGHTASLFPETEALRETSAAVVANYVQKFDTWRLTLTAPYLSSARHAVFLVAGPEKAHALHLALEAPPVAVPAQLIRAEEVEWLVDRAAAAKCRGLSKL